MRGSFEADRFRRAARPSSLAPSETTSGGRREPRARPLNTIAPRRALSVTGFVVQAPSGHFDADVVEILEQRMPNAMPVV